MPSRGQSPPATKARVVPQPLKTQRVEGKGLEQEKKKKREEEEKGKEANQQQSTAAADEPRSVPD